MGMAAVPAVIAGWKAAIILAVMGSRLRGYA